MKFQSFIQAKQKELTRRKKLLKRKALVLKIKIFFLGILPVVIVLLAVKTLQTLLRIKLRQAASCVSHPDSPAAPDSAPVIKPVTQTFSKPDFVTPVPVSQDKESGPRP